NARHCGLPRLSGSMVAGPRELALSSIVNEPLQGQSEHSGDPDQPFQAIPITHSDRSRSVWRGLREGAVGCIS
ncbi:MAG: hypothetical protein ACXWCO_19155, partial [Caldimonas sp.]